MRIVVGLSYMKMCRAALKELCTGTSVSTMQTRSLGRYGGLFGC